MDHLSVLAKRLCLAVACGHAGARPVHPVPTTVPGRCWRAPRPKSVARPNVEPAAQGDVAEPHRSTAELETLLSR